jgi:hypothetical protein
MRADRVLDDFRASTLDTWLYKPNVELAVVRSGGDGVLSARVDFSEFDYAWLRKGWRDEPLDARLSDGVRFRIRARGVERVLVHVMTGDDDEYLTTYEIAEPLATDFSRWQTVTAPWLHFGGQTDGAPLDAAALSRVRYINVSVTGRRGDSAVVHLDDLALVKLPPEELARLRHATPCGWREAGEPEFFAALNCDSARFPGSERITRALPREADAPAEAYAWAKAELLAYMRGRARPVYFLPEDARAEVFREISRRWPDLPEQTRRRADAVCEHVFEWEGQRRELTRPFDWQPGPSEWNAVLNRFGYLNILADAYRLTGDEKYAQEVVALLDDWIAHNPVPARMTRARTWFYLEAACRCDSWVRAWVDCLDSPAMTPEANYRILRSLAHHARWLQWYNQSRVAPNMIIVAAKGLGFLGSMFPEFRESAQWRRDGIETISNLLDKWVLPSGAWIEVTPGYHTWVAVSCLGLFSLARSNDVPVPERGMNRWQSMFEWLIKVAKPDGHMPMLGDCGHSTVVSAMSEAALEFGRGEFRYFGRSTVVPEQLLRIGTKAAAGYEAAAPKTPPWLSLAMPDCGLYVMRTGWGKDDRYLVFDAGPMYSHTHQDTLGFQMYAYGDTLVWDAGTCNYNLPEDRAYYRQARAHSLVMIDGLDLQLDGTPTVRNWLSEKAFDLVEAEAGYANVPVRHRRQILFVKPDYWIIRDMLSGRGSHRFEQQFHLGVGSRPKPDAASHAIMTGKAGGPNVWLACVAPSNAAAELVPGLISYNHGTPGVTSNLEAPVASFRFQGDCDGGPVTFVTVLMPLRESDNAPVIEALPSTAPGAVAFRVSTAAGTDNVMVAGDAPVRLGSLTLRNQIGVLRAPQAPCAADADPAHRLLSTTSWATPAE